MPGLLILIRKEASVVVFPEPVGPVFKIIPLGLEISFLIISNDRPIRPKDFKSKGTALLSKSRKTMLSPNCPGRVETLMLTSFVPILISKWPFCGISFTFIFNEETILILERRSL